MRPSKSLDTIGQRPLRRWSRIAVCAVLVVGVAAGCGDDDDSPEGAFCDAAESLRTDINGLGDIDIIAGGTSALQEQFSAIQSDANELKDSGADVAADEIDGLDAAVEELGSALDALGADVSVDGARAVADAATTVVTAAGAVLDKLSTTCP